MKSEGKPTQNIRELFTDKCNYKDGGDKGNSCRNWCQFLLCDPLLSYVLRNDQFWFSERHKRVVWVTKVE